MVAAESCKQKVLSRIDAMVGADGGARGVAGKPPDALTTAQLLVLASKRDHVAAILDKRIPACIQYLWSCRHGDGHWERPDDGWHSSITAWVLCALARWDNAKHPSFEQSMNWLQARSLPAGGVSESLRVAEPNTYAAANAIAAWHSSKSGAQLIEKNLAWLRQRQDVGGGFQDNCVIQKTPEASISSYVWHGIEGVEAEVAAQIRRDIERYLPTVQRRSGAWTTWYDDSDTIEGTAAALRVLVGTQTRASDAIDKGFQFLSNTAWPPDEWWITSSLAYLIGTHRSFN